MNLNTLEISKEKILSAEGVALSDHEIAPSTSDISTLYHQLNDAASEQQARISEQKYRHIEDEHTLRKQHLDFLSKITMYWLLFIVALSWLQGFKGLGFVFLHLKPEYLSYFPFYIHFQKFELSDAIFITLMTTTTATILGLYTIAAIWLYRANKGKQQATDNIEHTSHS